MGIGFEYMLETDVCNYRFIYQSDLTPFKCWTGLQELQKKEVTWVISLARTTNADVWQAFVAPP